MNTFFRIDINLFTTIYLGVVLYLAYLRLDHRDAFNRLFFKGCLIIMLLTLFEAVTCVLNRHPSPWFSGISNGMHVFLFAFPPLIAYYWCLLSNTLTLHGNVRDMKIRWKYMIPVAVIAAASMLSPVFHFFFYIDKAGIYHRGPFFPISSLVTLAYLFYGLFLLLKRRKNLLGPEVRFLTLFCLMPIFGGLIQAFSYGVLLLWPSSACALTILYLYLQERMAQTDYLTAVWTRQSFESCVTQKLKSNEGKQFGVIYADIDNLKGINDRYGHLEGDAAIKASAKVIQSALQKENIIARLGGDEFAILLDTDSQDDLNTALDRIRTAIRCYNETSEKEYDLSLSLGAELFRENSDDSVEAIIKKVDQLMYADKRFRNQGGAADPSSERGTLDGRE